MLPKDLMQDIQQHYGIGTAEVDPKIAILNSARKTDKKELRVVKYYGEKTQSVKYSASYVFTNFEPLSITHEPLTVKSETDIRFGRISTLFEHRQNETVKTWAVINLYPLAELSRKLFWYCEDSFVERRAIPLSFLSEPLVTAREENKLWFINANFEIQGQSLIDESDMLVHL